MQTMAGRLQEVVSTALSAITAERGRESATSGTTSSSTDAAESLYQQTVKIFTPKDGPLRKGRGHYKAMLKFKIFLLGEPTDTLPSQKLQRKLKDQGMGSPKHGEKWSILRKSWTTKELEDYMLSLYPGIPLNLVGFNFGKASKTRKIEKVDFQSVSQLKKSVRKGKLFVIPKRTLMEPETSFQDDLPDISDHEMENEDKNLEEESSDSDDTDHESIQSTVNICPQCHHTLEINQEPFCLICKQNSEFEESLKRDQEKALQYLEDGETDDSQTDAHLDEVRRQRRNRVTDEPREGIVLKFKNSKSWDIKTRKFNLTDSVQAVSDYVGSFDEASEFYNLILPDKTKINHLSRGTLSQNGLTSNSVIQIEWLPKGTVEIPRATTVSSDASLSVDTTNVCIPGTSTSSRTTEQDADLPIITTVRPRRKRRAASRVARAQIREWCNRGTHELSRVSSDEENASILVLNDDASHAEGSIPGHATEAVVSDTYRNYVENVICIDESDEEFDMEKSSGVEDDNREIEDMSYILTKLSSTINKETVTRFNIHRPTIWDCTLRKLKRGFDPRNELLIKFSDDFGSTEAGIDQGGPKREYLNLILEYIINSKLFEGGDNNKTLSWLKSANDKDEYFYAGLMIAVCLVHGGPAPHCFAPCLVEALEKGPMNTKVSLKDMPDPELKAQLEKVLDARSQQDLLKALEDIPFLNYAGIDYYTCSPDQANSFVSRVVHAYLFDRASQSFERFRCGLQTLGVMENFSSLKELFLVKNVTLNRVSFEDIFQYTLSPEMSNTRQRETSIVALWRDFLEDVESGKAKVTFSKILQFCTGSKVIPPLGFHPKPTISFQYQRFPKGITCTNNLILPLQTSDFEEFVSNLEFGILNTEGFLLE